MAEVITDTPRKSKDSASSLARPSPVLVDLGRKRRRQVRQLRRGQGKLMDKVMAAIDELQAAGRIGATAQPVIIVVRERRKKAGFGMLGL